MDISEVSSKTGLAPSTLRYYEKLGLIQPTGRQYAAKVVDKLNVISLGRIAGISLEDIGSMFKGYDLDVDRELINQRIDDIERQVQQLNAIKATLMHVANFPAPSHMECENFQQLIRTAKKLSQR